MSQICAPFRYASTEAARTRSSWNPPRIQARNQQGFQLVEIMVASLIAGFLMAAMIQLASNMIRACSQSENQILATIIAQELIDSCRNTQYNTLSAKLSGAGQIIETVPLYQYPTSPTAAVYKRPILQNDASTSGMKFSAEEAVHNDILLQRFNGIVTLTLTRLSADDAQYRTGRIGVQVDIEWADSTSGAIGSGRAHRYVTTTMISQSGIHN